MPLNREQKQAIVEKVSAAARTAVSVVIADATGVPVNELTKLRREARAAQVYLHVVRNTLLARALAGSEFEQVNPHLAGSSLVALAQAHPGAGARLFVDFAKRNNNFNIKYFVFEGKFHEGSEMSAVSYDISKFKCRLKLIRNFGYGQASFQDAPLYPGWQHFSLPPRII